jgi:hypothetical protein
MTEDKILFNQIEKALRGNVSIQRDPELHLDEYKIVY